MASRPTEGRLSAPALPARRRRPDSVGGHRADRLACPGSAGSGGSTPLGPSLSWGSGGDAAGPSRTFPPQGSGRESRRTPRTGWARPTRGPRSRLSAPPPLGRLWAHGRHRHPRPPGRPGHERGPTARRRGGSGSDGSSPWGSKASERLRRRRSNPTLASASGHPSWLSRAEIPLCTLRPDEEIRRHRFDRWSQV